MWEVWTSFPYHSFTSKYLHKYLHKLSNTWEKILLANVRYKENCSLGWELLPCFREFSWLSFVYFSFNCRFEVLWQSRYHAWPRLEEGARLILKVRMYPFFFREATNPTRVFVSVLYEVIVLSFWLLNVQRKCWGEEGRVILTHLQWNIYFSFWLSSIKGSAT